MERGRTVQRIVVMSDGTGNSAAKVWRTNVWRLYQALDLSNGRQVGLYDDGVGSSSFMPVAVLGGAFGFGLKRNVLDLYRFVCRNWKPGVDIYGFGFSRGAFTIRVLMGLIAREGLVPLHSESQLRRDAAAAYRSYRRKHYDGGWLVGALRGARDAVIAARNRLRGHPPYGSVPKRDVPSIAFLGLWDTVAAYGLPIEEMTRGVNMWLWPMSLPDRILSDKVKRARHALALDDARTTFHPVLWTEQGEKSVENVKDERISQVWFAGMHSNVGGGYPDDGLAHVSLAWMIEEARRCGLEFKEDLEAVKTECLASARDERLGDSPAINTARLASDQDGRLYDSRRGLGGYYRYGPRKLASLTQDGDHGVVVGTPKIHESVFQRIGHGARAYAPIGLPATYAVVTADGSILKGAKKYETTQQAAARAQLQERVWDLVWRRRIVYFATLLASLYLGALPWMPFATGPGDSSPWSFIAGPLRAGGAALPGFANRWIDTYAANPGWFLLGAVTVAVLMSAGGRLQDRIVDDMRGIWQTRSTAGALPDSWIYRLRTNRVSIGFFHAMKQRIVPTGFAVLIVLGALVALNRAGFAVASSLGLVCRSTPGARPVGDRTPEFQFRTDALCAGTGFTVTENVRYRITLRPVEAWKDWTITVPEHLAGFEANTMSVMSLAVPLRRSVSEPWFRPFARIGSTGRDTYVLQPVSGGGTATGLVSELTARTSGELFLYVNDAVFGLPWLVDLSYANNVGTASVVVERVAPGATATN
jgi:uncharacterized protein (DUF2235 family)